MTRRVLVVDDDPFILQIVATVLDLESYAVLTAENAAAAWSIIVAEPVDLLVLDVMMPGMDGLELTAKVRADPTVATLPIVLLTARSSAADRRMAKEVGADAYHTKPFSPLDLIATIDRLLADRTR